MTIDLRRFQTRVRRAAGKGTPRLGACGLIPWRSA